MVRVCTTKYPKGFSYNRKDGFYMDRFLKNQLDVLIKNVANDWDFTIIISGRGEVRVGKSVLAQQIVAYWTHEVERLHGKKLLFNIKNIVFQGKRLIEAGNYLGQNYPMSGLIYDEAGADLSGLKVMSKMTQEVLDYFRECGQYNMLNVLVLPDFFDLPKAIAITRSKFLIDVDYSADDKGIFQRGFARFYSAKQKKGLYIKGRRMQDYDCVPCSFPFRFYKFYPLPMDEYKELKKIALKDREMSRGDKWTLQRNYAWRILNKKFGMTMQDIADHYTNELVNRISKEMVSMGISDVEAYLLKLRAGD